MLKSRKILALILVVMLVFSALSGVTIAASAATAVLPEGYMVVNAEWSKLKKGEKFKYTLGGEEYSLQFGINAFATIEEASVPFLPNSIERTIVLAPGSYSSITLTSDVKLCGPYFGKSPNNKPGTDYYDSSLADWAVANSRSVDPTKEALFTGDLIIGTGCNNVTLDGIAFTGTGKVTDDARANEMIEVNYTFKNLYFYGCTGTSAIVAKKALMVNRHITLERCRIENSMSMTFPVNYYSETFNLIDSYLGDICANTTTNSQLYMHAIKVENVIDPMMMVENILTGNRFENIGGGLVVNFGNKNEASPTITQRIRVRLEVLDNEFINAGVNGTTVQCQFAGYNQELIIKNNIFRMEKPLATTYAINGFYGDESGSPAQFQYVEITGNKFYGYSNDVKGHVKYPWSNIYDNYSFDDKGVSRTPLNSNSSGKEAVAATDLTKYGNATVLTYKNSNRIYVDLTESNDGLYTFPKTDEIEAGGNVTCTVYPDVACQGNPITRIALKDKITYAYLKVEAPNSTSEIYTIYLFGYPTDEVVGEKSNKCSLINLLVPGASVVKNGDGYTVTAKQGAKFITPQLIVSDKASYKFYLDKDCKYSAGDNSKVNLYSRVNKFFIKVVAENGTESKAIPVTVQSERNSVFYADNNAIPSYARTAVNHLNKNGYGIFAGDNNSKLNPRSNITRYELAKVMVVLSGINVDMAESLKISDVFDDFYKIQGEASWAIPYIRAAYAAGLIEGVSDGKGNLYYNGSAYTTREQFATVFVRSVATAQGSTVNKMYKAVSTKADAAFKSKYADQNKISSWALKSVKLANYYGYVNGDGVNFKPGANIIRADVAVVIYNFVK